MKTAEACRKEAKLSKLDSQDPASFQPVEAVTARLLARPILQEYDAFTVVEVEVNPANQFGKLTDSVYGNLAARHNPVEIAEAGRREADACTNSSS